MSLFVHAQGITRLKVNPKLRATQSMSCHGYDMFVKTMFVKTMFLKTMIVKTSSCLCQDMLLFCQQVLLDTKFCQNVLSTGLSTGFVSRFCQQVLSTGFVNRLCQQVMSTGFVNWFFKQVLSKISYFVDLEQKFHKPGSQR